LLDPIRLKTASTLAFEHVEPVDATDLGDPADPDAGYWSRHCGLQPDGSCRYAGTDECDGECPFGEGRPRPARAA